MDKKKLPEEAKKLSEKPAQMSKSPGDQKESAAKLPAADLAGHKKQRSGNPVAAKVAVQKQPVHVVKDTVKTNGLRPPSKGLAEPRYVCD